MDPIREGPLRLLRFRGSRFQTRLKKNKNLRQFVIPTIKIQTYYYIQDKIWSQKKI